VGPWIGRESWYGPPSWVKHSFTTFGLRFDEDREGNTKNWAMSLNFCRKDDIATAIYLGSMVPKDGDETMMWRLMVFIRSHSSTVPIVQCSYYL